MPPVNVHAKLAAAVLARCQAVTGADYLTDLSATGQIFRGFQLPEGAPLPAVGVTIHTDTETTATTAQISRAYELRLFVFASTDDLTLTDLDPTGYGEMEERVAAVKEDLRRTLEAPLLDAALNAVAPGLGNGMRVTYLPGATVGDSDNAPVGQGQMSLAVSFSLRRNTQNPGS